MAETATNATGAPLEVASDALARRNVFFLGMVSLFTDLSSQMIYPIIPLFLKAMGVTEDWIGAVEGIAESTASLLRTVFGRMSDKTGKRKLFVFIGYGLSSISKPFLWFANLWPVGVVLSVKVSDRIGKAIRTPARDALISTSVKKEKKGKAFGFHRAMDRLGSVGGSLLAALALYLLREKSTAEGMRWIFLLSCVPAVLALIFVPFAKETGNPPKAQGESKRSGIWDAPFIMFLISSIVFSLGSASNAFLILKANEVGITSLIAICFLWAFYNLFCTITSPIFGHISDKIGTVPVIVTSFVFYSIEYVLFGLATQTWQIWALFAAHGVYYGLSDGIFRSYIADLVEPENRATAYGIINTGTGLALIPASIIFGVIWRSTRTSMWSFFVASGLAMLGFIIFMASVPMRRKAARSVA